MTISKKLLLAYPIAQYSKPAEDNQQWKNKNEVVRLSTLDSPQTSTETNKNWPTLQSAVRSLLQKLVPGLAADNETASNKNNVVMLSTQDTSQPSEAILLDTSQPSEAILVEVPERQASEVEVVPVTTTKPETDSKKPEIEIEEEGKGGWGDPHFDVTGSNGKRFQFDHKGKDGHQYHLFSGDDINIAGTYKPGGNPEAPQIIGEASISVGSDQIEHSKDGTTTLNGEKLDDGTHQLANGATIEKNGDKMTITPADGTGEVTLSTNWDGLQIDPSGKFSGLGGIIGKAIEAGESLSQKECDSFEV